MALSKINRNSLNTGISDSSDATAITINSSEIVSMPNQPVFRGQNFSAGVGTDGTTGYSASHSHFKVASIKLNVGNHFDNTNGIFTCPTAGVYYVNVSWSRNSTNWVAVAIIHNTTNIAQAWNSVNDTSYGYDIYNISAIISASANDKLYCTYANAYTAPSNAGNNSDMNIWKVA